jgi:YidC/Oxa1 family membrane protein insertase
MEKRIFYAFFLTFLLLIVYSYFFTPKKQEPIAEVKKEQVAEIKKETIFPEEDPSELKQISIGNFDITYSSGGGYIKKISIQKYAEELSFKNIGFIPEDKNKKFRVQTSGEKIIFTSAQGEQKEFIFQGYNLKIKLSSPRLILLSYNQLSPNMLEQGYQEFFYSQNNDLKRIHLKTIKKSSYNNIEFAGTRDRYFCLSLLKGSYNLEISRDNNEAYFWLTPSSSETSLYIGPQTEKELQPFGLQGIINYGFWHGIVVILLKIIHFLYFLTKNWGLSIIILTFMLYLLLFPFTMQSTKAMKRMQQVQPEIEELKKKYKDDLKKFTKEQSELFKKYKVNPLGGCLPFFFQLPIFFALYQVFLRLVELKNAQFLWIKNLSLPDHAFKLPFPYPIDYVNILPLAIAIIGLVQQKVATPKSLSSEQRSMGLIFSLLMGVVFYNFSASLTLYWFIQNLLTLIYQVHVAKT